MRTTLPLINLSHIQHLTFESERLKNSLGISRRIDIVAIEWAIKR